MIRIALVGSIGSGKTFISNLFGYPVFNADQSVSKIYSNNKKIFYKLKKRLPKFFTDSPIKKEELIKAIVKNKNSLNIISKIAFMSSSFFVGWSVKNLGNFFFNL